MIRHVDNSELLMFWHRCYREGLGPNIIRALVEDYGGKVRVEDRIPGDHPQGCRLIVELPAIGD